MRTHDWHIWWRIALSRTAFSRESATSRVRRRSAYRRLTDGLPRLTLLMVRNRWCGGGGCTWRNIRAEPFATTGPRWCCCCCCNHGPPPLNRDVSLVLSPSAAAASVNSTPRDICWTRTTTSTFIHSFIHLFIYSVSNTCCIWLKYSAKWAGQRGKLLILLPMIEKRNKNKYIRSVYILETIYIAGYMQFISTLVLHNVASRCSLSAHEFHHYVSIRQTWPPWT